MVLGFFSYFKPLVRNFVGKKNHGINEATHGFHKRTDKEWAIFIGGLRFRTKFLRIVVILLEPRFSSYFEDHGYES
jgi:hypothetical protein